MIVGATIIPKPYKVISVGIYLGAIALLLEAIACSFNPPRRRRSVRLGLPALRCRSDRSPGLGHRFWYQPPAVVDAFPASMRRDTALYSSIQLICLTVLAPAITRLAARDASLFHDDGRIGARS